MGINAIGISESDVYTVGNLDGNSIYWKNSTEMPLTEGPKPGGNVNAIFIK